MPRTQPIDGATDSEFEKRFPRRLVFATAAAGIAASVVAAQSPAEAAPPTTPWLLGGNSSVTASNFLGISTPGMPLVFKTKSDASGVVSEKMRLTAAGRLGLGITAPTARVDVLSSTVAIRGKSYNSSDTARGVVGVAANGVGVEGISNYVGVYGSGAYGLWAKSTDIGVLATGHNYGVYAYTESEDIERGYAIYALGNVLVRGTLEKYAGSFKIDHPLDPDNKWLAHSFVESPDMMNIYNGNVTTDASGNASITLPEYFTALNRDFRYQLTVLGQFAQAIVSDEIAGNTFTIRSDKPKVKVSWQVTGIRQDDYAKEHPIVVETTKEQDQRGTRQYVPKGSNANSWNPLANRPVKTST